MIHMCYARARNRHKRTKRREKDVTKKKSINSTCRICKSAEESLFHLLCSSLVLAPTLYLTVCHNQVARIIYQELMNHDRVIYKLPEVTRTEDKEIWWDIYVTTPGKVEHNRPDMVLNSLLYIPHFFPLLIFFKNMLLSALDSIC